LTSRGGVEGDVATGLARAGPVGLGFAGHRPDGTGRDEERFMAEGSAAEQGAAGNTGAGDERGRMVAFPSNGREAHGYLVLPEAGSGPGVIVIQEWWGVTDQVRGVVRRLADEGFVALAPDLFGGRTTHDADEAARMMQALPVDRAARDLAGAVDFLLGHDAVTGDVVGAVGFCMGGGFVIVLAAQAGDKIGAAVPFYGVVPGTPDLSAITAPVLAHFGEGDAFVPPKKARELERALSDRSGAEVTFHFYPDTGHAFFNEENLLGTYHPAHAEIAWERTVEFLRRHLGGGERAG
jgi:carboxymethylenebutenolidase